MSLRTRLTLGTVGTLAAAICVGLLVAYFVVRGELRGEIDDALRGLAQPLLTLGRQAPTRSAPPGLRAVPARPNLGGAVGYLQFVDRSGKVTRPVGERTALPTDGVRAVASGRSPSFFRDAAVNGTHLRIYTAR